MENKKGYAWIVLAFFLILRYIVNENFRKYGNLTKAEIKFYDRR
jgi:hypothetical protein